MGGAPVALNPPRTVARAQSPHRACVLPVFQCTATRSTRVTVHEPLSSHHVLLLTFAFLEPSYAAEKAATTSADPQREQSLTAQHPQADKLALKQEVVERICVDQANRIAPAIARLIESEKPGTPIASGEHGRALRVHDETSAVR